MSSKLVNLCYLIDIRQSGQQVCINQLDLNKVVVQVNHELKKVMSHVMERTESFFLMATDNIFFKLQDLDAKQKLIDFSFKYCYAHFLKVASSKLLLRNERFLFEIDALKRHIDYLEYDNKSLVHKVKADLTKKFLDELMFLTDRSFKTREFFNEYKTDTAKTLSRIIDGVREEKLIQLK